MSRINPQGDMDHAYVFRHRESQRATTCNVHGGREHGPAGEANEKTKTGNTDKQPNKEKGKSNGKKNRGTPSTETPNNNRDEFTDRRCIGEKDSKHQTKKNRIEPLRR